MTLFFTVKIGADLIFFFSYYYSVAVQAVIQCMAYSDKKLCFQFGKSFSIENIMHSCIRHIAVWQTVSIREDLLYLKQHN